MDKQTGERNKSKMIPEGHREIVHASMIAIEEVFNNQGAKQWKIDVELQGNLSLTKQNGFPFKWSTYAVTLGKGNNGYNYPLASECPDVFQEYYDDVIDIETHNRSEAVRKKELPKKEFSPKPLTLYMGRGDMIPKQAEKFDKMSQVEKDEWLAENEESWTYRWKIMLPYFDQEGKAVQESRPPVQESRPPVETVAEQETMSALHSTSEVEEEPQEIDELDKMKNRINEQQMFIMRQSSTGYGASILSDAERNIPCVDCKIELLSRYANSILDSILLGQTPPYIKNHQHPDQETDEETQDLLDQAEEDMEK